MYTFELKYSNSFIYFIHHLVILYMIPFLKIYFFYLFNKVYSKLYKKFIFRTYFNRFYLKYSIYLYNMQLSNNQFNNLKQIKNLY